MQIRNIDCSACGKKQLIKNEIGLNKKILGNDKRQLYCIDCLANYLEVTTEDLLAKIEEFKSEGCTLF